MIVQDFGGRSCRTIAVTNQYAAVDFSRTIVRIVAFALFYWLITHDSP